jgi:subtilase family serine protease
VGSAVLGIALAVAASAQTPATSLVNESIDEGALVTLHGSVHPMAQAQYDEGAVPDALASGRVVLLLNRPAEREAALAQFLQDAHTRGPASYHKWITPEQFGTEFGAADADIQTAVGWLISHGFDVSTTSESRQFIEFSGTAGELREAFHTEIHQYNISGEMHYANSSELKIPAALAALVRGVSPLNDFRARPQMAVAGRALYSSSTKKTVPLWTMPNPGGAGNFYAVAPADFATQYDLGPLYQAGVNGMGQTIGIINESNINLGLVQAYQSLFGIAGTTPQVVIDGDDPGDVSEVDSEAYLDVELSGAVAPKATVKLYIASGDNLNDPLELAAIRAVEDNQASVLSLSFGACENELGTAGNQFWSGLWEQAAAQGQTVLVSAGDSGSECFFLQPDTVNGLASTAWNVAVGGTDFYYADWATGGASAGGDWNQTNDGNLGSLKAPLPEQVWNDDFGLDVDPNGLGESELYEGGGGTSNCSMPPLTTGGCSGGYAKPSWQTGAGVPADGARDLPDVSLFAANGFNLSAYAVCAYAGECVTGTGENAEVYLVGGTSASSPAMAGIMALVNQKYGRQGQANYTLYPLAKQKPAAFHDITLGSNQALCWIWPIAGCTDVGNGIWETTQFLAGPGYDLASGLGTVDANVLVSNWNSITFEPTTTTLEIVKTRVAHGTPVVMTTKVMPKSGSGTPTGNVAIEGSVAMPVGQSQLFIPLSNGTGTSSVNDLPAGEYTITGHYGGDGTFARSTSQPVTLTVTAAPVTSNVNFAVYNELSTVPAGAGVVYDSPLTLVAQPGAAIASAATNGVATGSVTFTVDSTKMTVPLNGAGMASWTPTALGIGAHTASATYSGDANFDASTSSAVPFNITKGYPMVITNIVAPESSLGYLVNPGGSVTIDVELIPGLYAYTTPQGASAPTGTVTVCLGTQFTQQQACQNPSYSQTVTLSSPSGLHGQDAATAATFSNLAAGTYEATVIYNGDANWNSQAFEYWQYLIYVAPMGAQAATTTTLSVTPSNIHEAQTATLSVTVSGSKSVGVAPTGLIYYTNNGNYFASYTLNSSNGTTGSLSFTANSTWFWNNGANQLQAIYLGDSNYASSTSNVVNVTAAQAVGDFTLAAQVPLITVQGGSSGTGLVNLGSMNGFSGTVALSCAPSSNKITCSVKPGSVSLNGTSTATLTVQAVAQATSELVSRKQPGSAGWQVGTGILAFGMMLMGGRAHRRLRRTLLLCLGLVAVLGTIGCGFWGKLGTQATGASATYNVVVTGTGSGIVHNAQITVVVP